MFFKWIIKNTHPNVPACPIDIFLSCTMKSHQKQVNVSNEQDGVVHADRTHVENTLQQQRQKTTAQPGWIWGSGALGDDSSPSKDGLKKGGSGKNKSLKGNTGKSNGT